MIKYVKGDATEPQGINNIVIHVVNDIGRFGSGFAKAVMDKYPIVRERYIEWAGGKYGDSKLFALGEVQLVNANDNLMFCNMVAQHGTISKANPIPIKYDALRSCLKTVAIVAKTSGVSWNICGPRFGSGLAGGNWNEIEKIINEELTDNGIDITIYDL